MAVSKQRWNSMLWGRRIISKLTGLQLALTPGSPVTPSWSKLFAEVSSQATQYRPQMHLCLASGLTYSWLPGLWLSSVKPWPPIFQLYPWQTGSDNVWLLGLQSLPAWCCFYIIQPYFLQGGELGHPGRVCKLTVAFLSCIFLRINMLWTLYQRMILLLNNEPLSWESSHLD